jgi:hypothetical protein
MRFEYKLKKAGWATATLVCSGQTVEMTVSYLHDSLKNLLTAVIALRNGAIEASVIFMDEPGEHRLTLTRIGDSDVHIAIDSFSDWKSWGLASHAPERLLECTTAFADLRDQVLSATRALLAEVGEAEYKARWIEHNFLVQRTTISVRGKEANPWPMRAAKKSGSRNNAVFDGRRSSRIRVAGGRCAAWKKKGIRSTACGSSTTRTRC